MGWLDRWGAAGLAVVLAGATAGCSLLPFPKGKAVAVSSTASALPVPVGDATVTLIGGAGGHTEAVSHCVRALAPGQYEAGLSGPRPATKGALFQWPAGTDTSFWMRGTPGVLVIFWAEGSKVIGHATMRGPATVPVYSPGPMVSFTSAVELPAVQAPEFTPRSLVVVSGCAGANF
jgi:uncharacterized membrane protein (UPF0127 family)